MISVLPCKGIMTCMRRLTAFLIKLLVIEHEFLARQQSPRHVHPCRPAWIVDACDLFLLSHSKRMQKRRALRIRWVTGVRSQIEIVQDLLIGESKPEQLVHGVTRSAKLFIQFLS